MARPRHAKPVSDQIEILTSMIFLHPLLFLIDCGGQMSLCMRICDALPIKLNAQAFPISLPSIYGHFQIKRLFSIFSKFNLIHVWGNIHVYFGHDHDKYGCFESQDYYLLSKRSI